MSAIGELKIEVLRLLAFAARWPNYQIKCRRLQKSCLLLFPSSTIQNLLNFHRAKEEKKKRKKDKKRSDCKDEREDSRRKVGKCQRGHGAKAMHRGCSDGGWRKNRWHRLRLWPSDAEVGSAVPNPRNQRETVRTWCDCCTGSSHGRRFLAVTSEKAFDDSLASPRVESSGRSFRISTLDLFRTFFAISGTWFDFLNPSTEYGVTCEMSFPFRLPHILGSYNVGKLPL